MKIAAYYIAKFRELFKNEIEKNLSARESGFLIAKRALGRFFWSIAVYFVFVKRLDAPIVSKPPGMPLYLVGDIIRDRLDPYSMIFAWFSIFRPYV